MDHVVVAVLIAVATANLKFVMGIVRAGVARLDYWEPATPILATGSATAEVYVRASLSGPPQPPPGFCHQRSLPDDTLEEIHQLPGGVVHRERLLPATVGQAHRL